MGCGFLNRFLNHSRIEIGSQRHISVCDCETVAKPDDTKLDGFVFNGWFLDPDGTEAYDFETPVTENVTLYANWSVTGNENPSDGTEPPGGNTADDNGKTPADDSDDKGGQKDDMIQTGVEYVAPAAAGISTILAGIGAAISRRIGRRR